ncbi:beta strand repeat-containing protein [Lignipirellula cremea]|uniref:Inverse autotransporter beta-domain domain-containing protein n=1 Tax=Lignipirellula cremea TaxID=2528010 RepID=A0A518DUX7_9BACT|nr:hypothetical protein [Lignipirellula cremea]QDU95627.1 hypothetical protein Pla8534_34430 [Lignipirellula cremea]
MKAILRLLMIGVACGAVSWSAGDLLGQNQFNYDPGQAGGYGIPGGAESGFAIPGGGVPTYGGQGGFAGGPVNQGPIVSEWTAPTFPGIFWFSVNGANRGLGYRDTYFTVGAKTRLGEDFLRGRWMLENRLHLDVDDGQFFGNIGLERGFTIEPAHTDVYLSFWYDRDNDEYRNFGHSFDQVGVSAKLKNPIFDFYANGYIPIGETAYEIGNVGTPFFGNNILLQQGYDVGMRGFDASVRVPLPNLAMFGATLDLGGYYYTSTSQFAEGFGGFKGRVALKTINGIGLETEINHDDVFKTTFVLRATYEFGGGAAYDRNGRDLERTVRNDHIVRAHQDPVFLINAANGERFNIIYVDNTVTGGNGTFENPYDELADAEANSSPFDIIFVKNRSIFGNDTTGQDRGIVMQNNQQLLGGGTVHPLASANAGTYDLLIDDGGPIPSIGNLDGGPAVTLANDNTVRGFNFPLIAASSAIYGDAAGGLTTIDQNNISGTDGGVRNDGIVFRNAPAGSQQVVTQTSMTQLDGRGIDIFGGTPNFNFDGGSIDINGLVVQPGLNPIRVANTTAGSVVTIQNGLVTTTGSEAILLDNMSGTFNLFSRTTSNSASTSGLVIQNTTGTANISELTVTDSAQQGILIQNSVGLDANFGVATVNRAGTLLLADAVSLQNNTGATIDFNVLNINNQNGGGLIASNSGFIGINAGSITAVNGPAIDIDPTAIDITLSNVVSSDSLTTGVRLDRVSGSLNIRGLLAVSGVDVINGVEITNSGLLTVDVNSASINNTLGGAAGGAGVLLRDNVVPGSRFNFVQLNMNNLDSDGLVVDNTIGVTVGASNITNVFNGGSGIVLTNQANDVNFTGTTVINGVDGQGVSIAGNAGDNGTINFADLRLSNSVGDAFNISGGENNVNVILGGSGLANSSARSVSITNTTGGNVTFSGSNIVDNGSGIAINNNTGATSTYSFLNTVTVNSAVATVGAVELTNNTGAGGSINFNDLRITSTGAGTTGLFASNDTLLNIATGTVNSTNGPAVDISNTAVDVSLASVTSSLSNTVGLRLNQATGDFDVVGAINVSGLDVATGVDVSNSNLDFSADTITVANTAGGVAGTAAVNISNNTIGSSFNVNNLNISAVDSDGLIVNNNSNVNIVNSTINNLTGGGTGISLINIADTVMPGTDVNFSGITSITTVEGRGVSITGNGASDGTINFSDLRIAGATGTAFSVLGGQNDVAVNLGAAGIVNSVGRSVVISNTTGGDITFNGGDITDTGAGVLVSTNSGADSQYIFNNTIRATSSVANQGVIQVTNNTGATGEVRFADLQVTSNGAATAGLFGNNNTLLTVTDGVISANGGPSVSIATTLANINLTSASSSNSSTFGLRLANLTDNSSFTTGTLNVSAPASDGVSLSSIGDNTNFIVGGGVMTLNTAGTSGFRFRHNGETGGRREVNNMVVTVAGSGNNVNVFDMLDPSLGGPTYSFNNNSVNLGNTNNSTAWLFGVAGTNGNGTMETSTGNAATSVNLGGGSLGFRDFTPNMGGGTIDISTNGVPGTFTP